MKFESSDGKMFVVEEEVGLQCLTIKNGEEALIHGENSVVPMSNVDGKTLEKVLEYCKRHATAKGGGEEEEEEWDKKYIDVGEGMLYDLFMAANYLNIPGLLHLVARKVAEMIQETMHVEDIRELFNITGDFSPEEEEAMRLENPSAFRPKNPPQPQSQTPSESGKEIPSASATENPSAPQS